MYDLHSLPYYEFISTQTEEQLSVLWHKETAKKYEEMLEILPPIRQKESAFMVGECVTLGQTGAIYDIHIEIDGHYFWRPGYIQKFNPIAYAKEIRSKFYGICQSCGHPLDVNGMCTAPLSNAD
jgi:hypothetical protein